VLRHCRGQDATDVARGGVVGATVRLGAIKQFADEHFAELEVTIDVAPTGSVHVVLTFTWDRLESIDCRCDCREVAKEFMAWVPKDSGWELLYADEAECCITLSR
jgi:hypothetical protein